MEDSILTSTKKILGIDESYTAFDLDILTNINGVFTNLVQMGIGPVNGFVIEDKDADWVDFLGEDLNLSAVKTYIFLRVRMLFDPPTTSYLISAMNEQIKEIEWRLSSHRESIAWVSPIIPRDPSFDVPVLDGGAPA